MRGFLLATFIALAAGQSFAVQCPPDDGTGADILLPNPADCTSFYKCLNGVPYLMPCPSGLEWSDNLKRCEYPEIAQCEETEDKPTPEPTTPEGPTTSAKPKPDKCPEEDGPEDVLLPNPADCGSFFKCLNGVPHLVQCPAGQEWSVELNRCDYPEIAQCEETEISSTTQSSKPSTPRPDKCPAEDGPDDVLLPNPDDCGSFFKCLNGVPHLILCPSGQEWSIELSRCDFPEIAQCSVTGTKPTTNPTPTPSTSKPPVDGCPAEDGPEDVLLPNPKDCGSFYKCLNGIPHLILCPTGQHWSIELNRCDYPQIANCKETESKLFIKLISRPKENGCPAEDGPEDVLLPNPADCGSFYKCLGGEPVLHFCPPGLEWSVELNRCEYPDIAQCVETETSVTPESTTAGSTTSSKPPGPPPDHCPAEDGPEDVLLPNPDDCGSFFKCLGGEPQLVLCPPGLHWSIELNRCDYPNIAKCEQKKYFKSLFYDSECPLHNEGYDVFLPNPEDCSTYYQCSNGVKILKECPVGTLWDASMARCDHAANVNCKETNSKLLMKLISLPKENGCPAEDGPEDVLLPNPADCGSFYKCLGGEPVLHFCPPGLEWSVELNRCEYPEIAQCVETETSVTPESTTAGSTTSSKPPGPPPDHCPAEDGPEDVLLPNPDDCGSFFKCLGGEPQLVLCPPGLHWSIELNRCDYPNIAKCEQKKYFISFFYDSECPLHNEGYDVLLPNPEDCSTYYQCSNGVKILKECPVGTLWDVVMGRCDHAAIAQCA